MKQIIFKDGRSVTVDADTFIIPEGVVMLLKRGDDGNRTVCSYPAELVKDVMEYTTHPVRELAIKLLQATSYVPHGSRRLAEIAGIEYSDLIIPILKKLHAAGKVVFTEGKWARA